MKIMILGQTIFDAERWQHVGYCVDEDEDDDDDGSFNDTPNGSKPTTAITPLNKAHWQYV